MNILLTELSWLYGRILTSVVCTDLTVFGLYLRPQDCPYRPHARLIRGKYYMASSASGQDEPNRALWLATWAGKMEPSCPLGTTCCVLQAKFPQKPYNKSFIDPVCSVKMAGYWLPSFFAGLWTSTSSRSINTQKRTWPISSHLDLTLGQ